MTETIAPFAILLGILLGLFIAPRCLWSIHQFDAQNRDKDMGYLWAFSERHALRKVHAHFRRKDSNAVIRNDRGLLEVKTHYNAYRAWRIYRFR